MITRTGNIKVSAMTPTANTRSTHMSMRWIIQVGLGAKPVSIHDTLEEAMREVRRKWIAARQYGRVKWEASTDEGWDDSEMTGEVTCLRLCVPKRPMTRAEMDLEIDQIADERERARTRSVWRHVTPNKTDTEALARMGDLPSGAIDALAVVREDQFRRGMRKAAMLNDVSRDEQFLAVHAV